MTLIKKKTTKISLIKASTWRYERVSSDRIGLAVDEPKENTVDVLYKF